MKKVRPQQWSADTKKVIDCIFEMRFDVLPSIEQRPRNKKDLKIMFVDATKYAIKKLYKNSMNVERLQKATKEAGGIYYTAFLDLYGTALK